MDNDDLMRLLTKLADHRLSIVVCAFATGFEAERELMLKEVDAIVEMVRAALVPVGG